jgi:hypothetical protein
MYNNMNSVYYGHIYSFNILEASGLFLKVLKSLLCY